jgi:chaperonin GroEL
MKKLYTYDETQTMMNTGIQKVAEVVQCTLGPYGRNVAIMDTKQEHSQPLLTDDGVRVVEFALTTLTDLELLGAKLVYTSSKKTEEDVGDGTTSTYLMAAEVIKQYLDNAPRVTNLNPVLVRRGLNRAKDEVLKYLKTVVKTDVTLDVLTNIAISASGSDEIGKIVGELRHKLGADGLVNIKSSRSNTDVVNYTSGYEFAQGFVNQDLFSVKPIDAKNPLVLVIDKMIATTEDATAIINAYAKRIKQLGLTYDTPLVVLANKIEGEALKVIYQNWFLRTDKLVIPIIPVEVPMTSDHFGTFIDLGVITGAKVVSSQNAKLDIDELSSSMGSAENIKTGKKMTYIVSLDDEDTKKRISNHIESLKAEQSKLTEQAQGAEYANLMVRISKLNGVAVTIEVGGTTDIERTERKLKYDDAVLATHAAIKEGVLVGGGYTLFKAYHHLFNTDIKFESDSEVFGFYILLDALKVPFTLIPSNFGASTVDYLQALEQESMENLEDKILYINLDNLELEVLPVDECKVYDPYLVTKAVVENSVSAASLFISTERAVLVELR